MSSASDPHVSTEPAAEPITPIVNRVALSGIITLDLDEYFDPAPRATFDLTPHLYEGIMLRERPFREALSAHDWTVYEGKAVAVYCSSEDALIPAWAWMLVTSRLVGAGAHAVVVGTPEALELELARRQIDARLIVADLAGARVVVKGCSQHELPEAVYGIMTERLAPHVQTLMFGEACSSVPVYKKPKATAAS